MRPFSPEIIFSESSFLATLRDSEKGLFGPIQLNFRLDLPEWQRNAQELRAVHESRQQPARKQPVDPQAPYRHIPVQERPLIRGMIPDDYGRLPGDNGYNTAYAPGQDPFSLSDAANTHRSMNSSLQNPFGGPWHTAPTCADQYGRLPGEVNFMSPFPPGHPALPQSTNLASPGQSPPTVGAQPMQPWLDPFRGYMAGLTRSIVEARLAQQQGNTYQYVYNNPLTYFDPDGLATQKQGGKPPQPQIGINGSGNTCPGQKAVDFVRYLIYNPNNTHCRLTFEVTCNGHSLDDILKQVQFEIGKPDCGSGNPACTRFKPGHDPFDKPGPCDPKSICISEAECNKGSSQIANDLIYEIGNWCGCKYKHAKNEQPAIRLCIACGFTPKQCRAAMIPGGEGAK